MNESRKADGQWPEVFLHAIATVVPKQSYTQDFALDFFLNLEERDERQQNFLKKIYAGTSIKKRHTVIDDYHKDPSEYKFYPPDKSLKPEPSTKKRNDLFIQKANDLSLQAARMLFAEQHLHAGAGSVTHLITISCTGFSAPGFDFHLLQKLGLPPTTRRYHIGFMGCYAALTGLSLARDICRSDPSSRVLMVNVELCSIHFQQKKDLDTMVANAIFADGVSAAFVSAEKDDSSAAKLYLDTFQSRLLDDSENDMAWQPGDHGFDMKLSAYVPRIINRNIHEVLNGILSESGLSKEDIDIWAIHPGGPAIVEKITESLGLEREDVQVSYDVLAEFGNMSSSTIMYVLKRILDDKRNGIVLALAFGPGLTVETGCFRKIR